MGNQIEPLAFILQKQIFGLWAYLMIYLKGLSSRLVVNFVLANIMSGFNVGLVCSNVLDVAMFEKGHKMMQGAACSLAGGLHRPGKDISAAFWENWESHRQRSLL